MTALERLAVLCAGDTRAKDVKVCWPRAGKRQTVEAVFSNLAALLDRSKGNLRPAHSVANAASVKRRQSTRFRRIYCVFASNRSADCQLLLAICFSCRFSEIQLPTASGSSTHNRGNPAITSWLCPFISMFNVQCPMFNVQCSAGEGFQLHQA